MSIELPPHIWFVRSNGGSGSYPIRREGWMVVLKFIAGMIGWGIAAAILTAIGTVYGPKWVAWSGIPVFAAGAALSAWYMIDTARRHTDYTITANDYVRQRKSPKT